MHEFTRSLQRCLLVAVLSIAGLLNSHASDSGRGRHKQLYAVPAPGPVVIDGALEDWDLSGRIEVFVMEANRSMQNVGFAMMYDDDALYVSGRVNDPTPMVNRHDPEVMPERAWDADACQLRLVVDRDAEYPVKETAFRYRGANAAEDTRDDIVHLLMWHYTDDSDAYLQMHLGMGYRSPRPEWGKHGLVPHDLFTGTHRKWEDGRGYTFEYRIPWRTLGADNPPSGGDRVAGTMQMHWGRPDGLAIGRGGVARDIIGRSGVPFQDASCWGRLFFAEAGDVSRERVLEGVPRERPLPLEFEHTLPADGETTIQLVDADGMVQRVLMAQQQRPAGVNIERWDGMDNHHLVDDHGDFLPAGTYARQGILNSERLRAVYRFSVHNSGDPPYRTADGLGGWGGDHANPQDVVALEDGLLFSWPSSEAGFGIIRTDVDGRKRWGSNQDAMYMASDGKAIYIAGGRGFMRHEGVRKLDVEDARPRTFADGSDLLLPPAGGEKDSNGVTGLAYGGDTLYVAFGQRDLVAGYDLTDATLRTTWKVADPGRMALRPDGRLAVISGNRVVTVLGEKIEPWLATNLDAPAGMAVAADGTTYVANRGALQNVSVFDADGKYLRSIGRDGGRPPMGAYDPQGMYMAGGIALDARGRLWVAETTDAPKRISLWDTETGENLDEFFGASDYFAYGHIDPARPDEIYAHNVIWEIDWETYTTTPRSTIWRRTEPDMAPHPREDAYSGVFRMITAENGRQFGWGGAPHNTVFVYMRDGDRFRPIVGDFNPWGSRRFDHGVPAVKQVQAAVEQELGRVRGNTRFLFWQDKGDDGRVSADEITVRKDDLQGLGTIIRIDREMVLWFSCGRRLPPRDSTDEGRPVYDVADLEETPFMGKLVVGEGGRGWTTFDETGAAYTVVVTQRGRQGSGLTRWTPDGELDWRFPDLIRWRDGRTLPGAGPGRLWGATQLMGVGGDFLANQNYFGTTHIFRRDGMYIGAVLGGSPSGRYDPSLEDTRYDGQSEGQGGSFVKLTINGEDRYFVIQGSHDVRVWEILGLDTLQDLPPGTYTHTQEAVETAQRAYAQYQADMEGVKALRIARGRDALDTAEPVRRRIEGSRGFEARLAYDDENLYVRYRVDAPHGLTNGQSAPEVVFRGGNLIDIQLATDPEADPDRTEPAPGDLRLLVTRQDGKPFAVLFQPRVAGFAGKRSILRSPTGQEPFDAITEVDVGLDYKETKAGFTATVTVPLETLGFQPTSGQEVRMDLGYVFGNKQGTKTVVRAYLNNNSFSANIVDDIPNESRIEPNQWGKATVE